MAAGDAGAAITKATINDAAFQVSNALVNAVEAAEYFKAWLDGVSAADLETAYGFSAAGAADLKSAFGDLGDLAAIYRGNATLGTARDFDTFARRLRGTNLH